MKTQHDDREVTLCVYCPTLCLSRCPVAEVAANITYSPWGKQSSVWRLTNKILKPSQANALPAYMCLDCLACRENCNHDVNVPANLAGARVLFAEDTSPLVSRPGGSAVRLDGSGGLKGLFKKKPSPEPDPSPLPGTSAVLPEYDPEAGWRLLSRVAPTWHKVDGCQALLIPGMELLQEDSVHLLEAIFRALDNVGDKVVGVTRDSALECGHHLYAFGYHGAALAEARRARKRFGRYKRLVFGSPHCASFVALQWPEVDLERARQATTLLEFIGKRIDFRGSGYFSRKVAYHDPCHLGRHLGLYQVPRDILKWACNRKPVELLYSRERSVCCGGGYPLVTVAPQVSAGIANLVINQFLEADAEVLVSSCGQCLRQFRAAAPELKSMHILEIVAEMKS